MAEFSSIAGALETEVEGQDDCQSCTSLENLQAHFTFSDEKNASSPSTGCYSCDEDLVAGLKATLTLKGSDHSSEKDPKEGDFCDGLSYCVVAADCAEEEDTEEWPEPPTFPAEETESQDATFHAVCSQATSNMDVLLERILSERSRELTELQNAARPVTGSNARDNLLDFFAQANQPSNNVSQRSLPDDVQNLVQRSIVTSSLRRHAFRSALENSLASRIVSLNSTSQIQTTAQQQARPITRDTSPALSSFFENDTMSVASDLTVDGSDAARDIEQLQRAVNVGLQMLSETIEEDLTQLHHLHVVSSALGGDFRNDLETLIQQRVMSVGGGEIVQRFIRSLPSTQNAPLSTPHQTFPAPSNATSSRVQADLRSSMAAMEQQMEEMKRMMQMSFELQMETQRAFRQEVAAVYSAFAQQEATHAATCSASHQTGAPPKYPAAVAEGACVICLDNQVDAVLYQCGHMCVCNGCGIQLKMQGHNCPICRAPIREVIRAYKSQCWTKS